MEIKYHLTEEDYLNFNLFHVRNSKSAVRSLNIQRFMGPIIFIVAAFFIANFDDSMPIWLALVAYLLASILWIVFYPKYYYGFLKRMTKKMLKEGKNEGLLGDHLMRMTDEGIVDSHRNGETRVNWSGIQSFKESDDTFYIYNSAVSAYILPKRDMADPEEVRSFIQSKINSGKD